MIFFRNGEFRFSQDKVEELQKRSSRSVNNETCKIRYFFPNFFLVSFFFLILGMCFCVRFPSSPIYLCKKTWRVKKKFGAEEVQHNNNNVDVPLRSVFFSVVFLLSHRNNEEFRLRLKATFSFSLRRDEWPTRSIFPAGRMKCRPMDGDTVLASVVFDPDSGLLFKRVKKKKRKESMYDGCG